MKYRFLFFLFFCFPLFAFHVKEQEISRMDKPATIKILLEKNSNGVFLEARGPFVVYNPQNGKKLSLGHRGKRSCCYPHNKGIKWGEDFPGIFQLQIEPTSSDTTFLVNGVQYRGAIGIYHIEDMMNVVNEVDVESFIKSVLSESINHSLSRHVLEAIAMIARTNAYYLALANKEAFWHVTAKEVGYQGIGLTLQNLAIESAIDNTRYHIMLYEEQPFPSSWTQHCSGKTANYESIFRKNISTPDGITSPFAMHSRLDTYWSFTLDTQELAKIVKTNRVTGIKLFMDHLSEKVYAIRIFDGTYSEDVSFQDLQGALGKERLKSNDFIVTIKSNLATFQGYGEGIGVGLCIYSALQMEERGDTAPQILSTFFPCTQIEKMRVYPECVISAQNKRTFISPKQQRIIGKKHKLLHK